MMWFLSYATLFSQITVVLVSDSMQQFFLFLNRSEQVLDKKVLKDSSVQTI